jgi:hypothetical protein
LVIETATGQVIKTLEIGAGPFFSVANPRGNKFHMSNSQGTTVAVIDIPSLTVLPEIPDVRSSPFDFGILFINQAHCAQLVTRIRLGSSPSCREHAAKISSPVRL